MVNRHISRISYRFGVIRHCIFGWQLPIPTNFRGVFMVKHPKISELHISHPKKGLPYTRPRLLSYCALKLVQGMGCSFVEECKNKKKQKKTKKKSQYPYMLTPRGVSTAHWTRTKFGRADNLPDVITHAKFQIDWNKIVSLGAKFGPQFVDRKQLPKQLIKRACQ